MGGIEPEKFMVNVIQGEQELERLLSRFWETEEMPSKRVRSKEEEECEAIFVKGHSTDSDGRYHVKMPLRDSIEEIGSSREAAWRRYLALERRSDRDPAFEEKFKEQIPS